MADGAGYHITMEHGLIKVVVGVVTWDIVVTSDLDG